MKLNHLVVGQSAIIKNVNIKSKLQRRLLDLGFVEGTSITCLQESPKKDPTAYLIRGAVIALRNEDAYYVEIYE